LREAVPPEEVLATIKGLREDEAMWANSRPVYDRLIAKAEQQLRDETRSIRELLGEKSSERLLDSLENLDGDPEATKAFLKTPAVEGVVGSLLYEGIFEFIKTVDILGNIVNGLPIIGPIRQQILGAVKKELDTTLGRQVKGFLGSYSRLATDQLVSMVLDGQNTAGFGAARRKLGEQVLSRPVSSLVPPEAVIADLRDSAWAVAREPLPIDEAELINRAYDAFGDESLDGLEVGESAPARLIVGNVLERFISHIHLNCMLYVCGCANVAKAAFGWLT